MAVTPGVIASTASSDQEKFLASQLIERAALKLVAASLCDAIMQPDGTGLVSNFVRYNRMNVPMVALTEGTTPTASTISLSTVTATLEQWGDWVPVSDVSKLTTMHPLTQEIVNLLADNAQRVIDREVQVVWLAGTNVVYGDATVTTRATVTSSMKVTDTLIHRWRVTLVDGGASPRGGPINEMTVQSGGASETAGSGVNTNTSNTITQGRAFVAVAGTYVVADVMQAGTSLGTWASTAMYANQKALYNSEMGTWLGIRWVETNFIPKFQRLGDDTAAVSTGNSFGTDTPVVTAVDGGGTLTSGATYYYKVVKKDKTRGFGEFISLEHTTAAAATGNNESFTFAFTGVSTSHIYDLYFGSATGDANLKLHTANIESGTTVTVTAVPSSTTTAPANTGATVVVHPVYIFGERACARVKLQALTMHISKDGATTHDPLNQQQTMGYKFMGKAVILDQLKMLRGEVASTYA